MLPPHRWSADKINLKSRTRGLLLTAFTGRNSNKYAPVTCVFHTDEQRFLLLPTLFRNYVKISDDYIVDILDFHYIALSTFRWRACSVVWVRNPIYVCGYYKVYRPDAEHGEMGGRDFGMQIYEIGFIVI